MLSAVAGVGKRFGDSMAAFAAVGRNANLRWLELAWTASIVGQYAFLIAVSVYAYGIGGEKAVGLIFLARLIPAALIAPFAGMLGDRYPRERVLLFTNVTRIVLVGAAAVGRLRRRRSLGRLRLFDRRHDRHDAVPLGASCPHAEPCANARRADRGECGRERCGEHRGLRRPGSRRRSARSREHRGRLHHHGLLIVASALFLLLIHVERAEQTAARAGRIDHRGRAVRRVHDSRTTPLAARDDGAADGADSDLRRRPGLHRRRRDSVARPRGGRRRLPQRRDRRRGFHRSRRCALADRRAPAEPGVPGGPRPHRASR